MRSVLVVAALAAAALLPACSPTPPTAPAPTASTTAAGAALAQLASLEVKGRAPKTGYSREQFGPAWQDVDGNGCNTRDDVLAVTLTDVVREDGCDVVAGTLADPYTGTTVDLADVEVDHRVALLDAWQKGAQQWSETERVAFANDPLNLQPTLAEANRAKGASDVATWLPPNRAHRCTYVARIVAVKARYAIWVTAAEADAMRRVLEQC